MEYDAFLDSEKQVDSSDVNGSLRVRVGEGAALLGLGERLVGLHEGDERLVLDFNHPLAGESLTLFVRIRKVVPPHHSRMEAAL